MPPPFAPAPAPGATPPVDLLQIAPERHALSSKVDGIANGLSYALQYLAMCILLILSLVKSGTWARDIVSGF